MLGDLLIIHGFVDKQKLCDYAQMWSRFFFLYQQNIDDHHVTVDKDSIEGFVGKQNPHYHA